jgi:hypothetical protein
MKKSQNKANVIDLKTVFSYSFVEIFNDKNNALNNTNPLEYLT